MVSSLKKASENAPGRALAMPRPCPSVRLQQVSQLLSLMSVTDERRIGYCGREPMFWPRRLAALCRVGARRVRPCSSRAGTGAKRAASARRSPRYQWHALIKLAGSSWVETASIRRLRVLRGCGSVSNYHSERANLFSTGAALRCERPGKKSRPDVCPVNAGMFSREQSLPG